MSQLPKRRGFISPSCQDLSASGQKVNTPRKTHLSKAELMDTSNSQPSARMEFHPTFFAHAKAQGITWNGISFCAIPGSGIGVRTARALKKGHTILQVPSSTYRTLSTLSPLVVNALPSDLTLHARLAADLSLDETPGFKEWMSVLPKFSDFQATLPFFWREDVQALLPASAKELLAAQKKRYDQDARQVMICFPDLSKETFTYFWMIVNSRSFYLLTPEMEKLDFMDRLCLFPVADLFNHADDGCVPSPTEEGYRFTTDRDYAKGEELKICYGAHSNDFLLVEYGFVPTFNQNDKVHLDDVIIPMLSVNQKTLLRRRGFLGNYSVDPEELGCFRTQVVLRLLRCSRGHWEKFVRRAVDGAEFQQDVNACLLDILTKFQDLIKKKMDAVLEAPAAIESWRGLLTTRWQQIELEISLCKSALKNKI